MARDFIQNSRQYLSNIDAEIERLQTLRAQVAEAMQADEEFVETSKQSPKPAGKGMSVAGRKRVAEAQKAR